MTMRTAALTLLLFLCLVAASLGSLVVSKRLPARYRQDDTQDVVRLAANMFVVTTSLVLGLLFNSTRNTFEAVDRNVHAFATDLILLDRTLRQYGPEASDVRERLAAYIRQAVAGTWGADGSSVLNDRVAERLAICSAPPSSKSSLHTEVITIYLKPHSLIALATLSGSPASSKNGLPLLTAQNLQPLVHMSPMIIIVAVPVPQHSDILGHLASSQTV